MRGTEGKIGWILFALLAAAALLPRVWEVDYDLPFVYDTDELVFTVDPSGYFFAGDFNPRDFRHPGSLLMYPVHLLLRLDYYRQSARSGITAGDYARMVEFAPGGAVYLGRIVNALASTLSVLVLLGIARRIIPGRGGWAAAFLLAAAPMHVRISRIARTDALALLLVLASIYCALRFLEEGSYWGCLAAFLAGLGGASKYVALGAALPAAAALYLRAPGPFRKKLLSLAPLILVPAGLFIGAPYVFLDGRLALSQIVAEEEAVMARYPVIPFLPQAAWYLGSTLPFSFGGLLVPLAALAGVFIPLRRDWRREAVVFAFPLVYFLFISFASIRAPRYILYLVPFAALLAARALQWCSKAAGRWSSAVFLVGLVLLLFQPVRLTVRHLVYQGKADVRTLARGWIEENVPSGQGIVYEASIPPLDQLATGRHRLWDTSWARIVSRPLEEYIGRDYHWMVISRDQKRIVLDNPGRWPRARERYREIEEKSELVASLRGRGWEVLDIYRLDQTGERGADSGGRIDHPPD